MIEQIFGLILTSCVIANNNNVVCEDFIIDTATTLEQCQQQSETRKNDLLEFDSLSCERLINGNVKKTK